MEELRRGLWLFGFESPNEARRILREGTGRFGGLPISLREWGKDVGCMVGRETSKTAWVRLLGLPLHLWSCPILKRIDDKCGGFLAEDENTAVLFDLRWAKIPVKWDGRSNPLSVVVSEGDRCFVIQLWWEFQPQMKLESLKMKPEDGGATREDREVSSRARESVELLEVGKLKMMDETEGALSCEESKPSSVELQSEGADHVRGYGCRSSMGPTSLTSNLRQARGWKVGSGEEEGGEPSAVTAQGVGPEAKLMEPLYILGPDEKALCPIQRGLRNSSITGHLSEEQKNCSNSYARITNCREATLFKIREEGGRRDDHFEAPPLVNDDFRYVESNLEDSPSSLFSVFGRPLLLGGSSGQAGPLKPNEVVDLEPLRMVAVDGSDWGLESLSALVAIDEGPVGEGQ